MAYRYDTDLEFLSKISSKDLDDLVRILTRGKDGSLRLTEELTSSKEYKQYHPDHKRYWQSIAAELQSFGANTLVTMLRGGKGVLYHEVLRDVCDKLDVNYQKTWSAEEIEQALVMKLITDAISDLSSEELKALAKEVGVMNYASLTRDGAIAAFITVFRAGGFKSYQILVTVVNIVLKALIGKGVSFAGTQILTKTTSILVGPLGWAVTAVWSAADIASPAYRVTIPAVIQIAALRQKLIMKNSRPAVKKTLASRERINKTPEKKGIAKKTATKKTAAKKTLAKKSVARKAATKKTATKKAATKKPKGTMPTMPMPTL